MFYGSRSVKEHTDRYEQLRHLHTYSSGGDPIAPMQEMPPGDSLNEYDSGHSGDLASDMDIKMEEQDWETKMMEEARFFKEISDELKAVGCPLFGGRYCRRLSEENREKAALLEDRLDSLLGVESSSVGSFRTRTRDELRIFIAQGDTLMSFKEKSMSLCAECFQNSNHQGHDFNRFFSQAGGACDCGNADVLRESGFCARHGPNAKRPPAPSDNIVSLAEFMIPKLFVRLFLYFRGWSRRYEELVEQKKPRASEVNKENFSSHLVAQAHLLIEFLQVCEFLFSFLCARSFIICYTTTMNMSTVGGGHYFGIHMVLSISSVALSFVIHT
ncbi:E3 ubiquitin-protein ligase UBR3 [Toxocara canis]|uniref:E3 ubiquitin-protein ligase n=1 Tax=Toxocara canis TaxID=6265 RepID=A0A0B2VP80_TOXCA|nr:E3 ubiquitin-protein ligase UBR3 [Toxocara canis]